MTNLFARLWRWWNQPPAPSPVLSDDTDLARLSQFVPPGFTHGVQVLNDSTTPMELVVEILQSALSIDRKEALQAMLRIHLDGGILLPMSSRAAAEQCSEAMSRAASAKGASLRVRAVSADA
jgi:ATP-dependent Clp protease adapter protein ClpS